MKASQLLGPIAISTTIAFLGAADAEARSSGASFIPPSVLPSTVLMMGAAMADGPSATDEKEKQVATDKKEKQEHVSPSVQNLGQRIALTGNLSLAESCFKTLGIEEKPLPQMLATDATKLVECLDQKGIDQFLSAPASNENRSIAANIVRQNNGYMNTSSRLKDDPDFGVRVAATCREKGQVTLGTFEQCAGEVYKVHNNSDQVIKYGLGGAALLSVALFWPIVSRRRQDSNGPSAQIS